MNITYGPIDIGRKEIADRMILKRNIDKSFKVIDIGGAVNGWTKEFVDCVVDINSENNKNNFKFDICVDEEWSQLLQYVDKNGKFDYCICTHTLEDLYNPITPLKYIPKVAKAGVITMPSAKSELSHIENNKWLGYIHHRWIFDKIDNKMLIIPKLNFLESIVTPFEKDASEIRYEWVDNINYSLFMNNYLGPTVKYVVAQYQDLIARL